MLYSSDHGLVALRLLQGDCIGRPCYEFRGGRWKAMPAEPITSVPLLAVESSTGSNYSDDLWSSVGRSGDKILINSAAAIDNLRHGSFDGVRIGMLDFDGQRHFTTGYATAIAFSGQGATLHLMPEGIEIYVGGDKAWLLHRRDNGAVDLIDLFALNIQTDPGHCLPGLYLEMASKLAGPPEKALSPNVFESRIVEPSAAAEFKASVLRCAATKFP